MTNPIEYQKTHPKEVHCHVTQFDDGSVAYEPSSTKCQQAVHPILISYQLETDKQLLHLTRSNRSPNLFQLHCENPKVSLPTDINGMHTSVSGLTAALKARVARHLKGYPVQPFGTAGDCDRCGTTHAWDTCPADEPEEITFTTLRDIYEDMKDAGHHLSVLEVSHTEHWVTVSTASKELQDQTNGEAGSVWTKEEPLITAKLMRRSPQHISYQSVWTGVSHAAKLEQGYLNVRDGMKDLERIMSSLCHARFDENTGRNKQ